MISITITDEFETTRSVQWAQIHNLPFIEMVKEPHTL